MDTMERIEELLEEAYSTDDPEKMERLAREILELEKDNVEALIILADTLEYSEEKIAVLEKARGLLADAVENIRLASGESFLDDDSGMLYLAVMQRLGFALFSDGRNEEALAIAREIELLDPERETLGRTLLYRVLLEMQQDSEVLEETLKDKEKSPAMAHSRAIASFRLSGANLTSYRFLWEAFSAGPDIPFFILGYLDEPKDESDEAEEDYSVALLFEDIWSSENELLKWLTRGTILLGLTASVFPPENTEKMMVLADALDIAEFAEDAMVAVESRDDWGILSREERISIALKMFTEGTYLPVSE
jgi:tetratricopeptide (TPR) repeat protein